MDGKLNIPGYLRLQIRKFRLLAALMDMVLDSRCIQDGKTIFG